MAYVRASKSAGTTGDALRVLQDSQVANLQVLFRRQGCEAAEAASIITEIGAESSDTFTPAQAACLVQAVQNACVLADRTTSVENTKTQEHLHLWNYLPMFVWETLKDMTKSEVARMTCLVDFCHAIGLKYPNQPSTKRAISIIINAAGSQKSPREAHEMFKKFVFLNKKRRETRKQVVVTRWVFPEDVNEFMAIHNGCYNPAHPPVESQVDIHLLRDVLPWIPSRSNNRLLQDACSTPPSRPGKTVAASSPNGFASSPNGFDMYACVASCVQALVPMMTQGRSPPSSRGALEDDKSTLERCSSSGIPTVPGNVPAIVDADAETSEVKDAIDKMLDATPKAKAKAKAKNSGEVPAITTPNTTSGKRAAIDSAEKIKPRAKAKAKNSGGAPATSAPKNSGDGPATSAPKKTSGKRPAAKPTKSPSSSPGSADGPFPRVVHGCRVLYSVKQKKYRVFPTAGSVFEKGFQHGTRPRSDVWRDVLAYCLKPTR